MNSLAEEYRLLIVYPAQTGGRESVLDDSGHAVRVSGPQGTCRAENLRDVIVVHGFGPFLPLARPI
jgi:hypothetical protein